MKSDPCGTSGTRVARPLGTRGWGAPPWCAVPFSYQKVGRGHPRHPISCHFQPSSPRYGRLLVGVGVPQAGEPPPPPPPVTARYIHGPRRAFGPFRGVETTTNGYGCIPVKCPRNCDSGRPARDMAVVWLRPFCAFLSQKQPPIAPSGPKPTAEGAHLAAAVPNLTMRGSLPIGHEASPTRTEVPWGGGPLLADWVCCPDPRQCWAGCGPFGPFLGGYPPPPPPPRVGPGGGAARSRKPGLREGTTG